MDANRRLSLTANEDGTVVVTNRHGTQITIDLHGKRGLTPLEMLLAALGSCSAVDIVDLMRKQRDPVTPLAADVESVVDLVESGAPAAGRQRRRPFPPRRRAAVE